jgi:hypothetical protein
MAYRLLTALTMLILTYCCAQAQVVVAGDRRELMIVRYGMWCSRFMVIRRYYWRTG